MKRIFAVFCLLLMSASSVLAADKVGPDAERAMRRAEMKKIKEKMRQERQANPAPKAPSKMDEFWKKEGERSGFGGTGSRVGNALKNLNPMPFFKNQNEQYKTRKAQGQVK